MQQFHLFAYFDRTEQRKHRSPCPHRQWSGRTIHRQEICRTTRIPNQETKQTGNPQKCGRNYEQIRSHHLLHGSLLDGGRTNPKHPIANHRVGTTKNHPRIPLVTETQPGHRLANWRIQLADTLPPENQAVPQETDGMNHTPNKQQVKQDRTAHQIHGNRRKSKGQVTLQRGLCCKAGILSRSEQIRSESAQKFYDPKWQ